jgi:bifunctional non-homologous end joining protein LigD
MNRPVSRLRFVQAVLPISFPLRWLRLRTAPIRLLSPSVRYLPFRFSCCSLPNQPPRGLSRSDSTQDETRGILFGHVVAYDAAPSFRLHRTSLPSPAPQPPVGGGWIHEIKHDGFRLMARRDAAGVRLLTRRGNDWTARYPSIAAALAALSCHSSLIDGEVVICGDDGVPVFDRLRYGRQPQTEAVLFAFDLLELAGKDLRRTPLEERKRGLAKLVRKAGWALQLNEHIAESGEIVFRHACNLGFEGIVSKRLGSPYVSGRSRDWIKSKNPAAPAVKREAEEDWGTVKKGRA